MWPRDGIAIRITQMQRAHWKQRIAVSTKMHNNYAPETNNRKQKKKFFRRYAGECLLLQIYKSEFLQCLLLHYFLQTGKHHTAAVAE